MNSKQNVTALISWWYWVVIIDVFLVLITLSQYYYNYPQAWRLIPAFDLGREMNLAVWWHGMLLATISFICYEFYLNQRKGIKLPWLSLSVVFIILSIDEICSVHERIDDVTLFGPLTGSLMFGFYMLLIFILASYPLLVFLRNLKNQKTGLFILFGFGFYASVYGQELIEHAAQFPPWFLGVRVATEEGSELLGTFIILFGVLALRKSVTENSFQMLIPEIQPGNTFHVLLWVGLLVQIFICLYIIPVLPGFDGHGLRGNPGIYYPTVINFILFCYLFWKSKALQGVNSKIVLVLSCIFLLSSMGCMYNLAPLIPKLSSYFSGGILFDGFRFLYLAQIVSVIITIKIFDKPFSIKDLLFVVALISIFILSFFYESLVQTSLLLGLFSFFIGYLFRRLEMQVRDQLV